ncbi:MAG TPA: ABC transporter permease, partial [Caulobacteraceae bacterium]|nr:ABC transporter permease [Caulobacteraceae bacterium]
LSNIREFASLRALGIGMRSLRLIVMEIAFWVGVVGILAAWLLTVVTVLAGESIGLPLIIHAPITVFVSVMMMGVAIVSGALAMSILKKSQPADLLR